MIKQPVTLEDLAVMVARGFEKTASKEDLKRLENRVGGLENRVGGLENKVGGLEKRVSRIEKTMVTKDYLDGRLASLEEKMVVGKVKNSNRVGKFISVLTGKDI